MSVFKRILLIWRAERLARRETKERLTYESAKQAARVELAKGLETYGSRYICPKWDAVVNELCDLVEVGQLTPELDGVGLLKSNTVKIGAFTLWVSSGNGLDFWGEPYRCGLDGGAMPEPITRVRLKEVLEVACGERERDICAELLDKTRRMAWQNNVEALPVRDAS